MKYILLSNFRFGSTCVMGYLSEKNKQHNMPNLWEYFTSTVIPCYCSNKLSVIDDIKISHYIINNYRNLPVKNINKNSAIPPNYKIFYEIKIDGVPINTIYKKVK